jgi:hypothetical protein
VGINKVKKKKMLIIRINGFGPRTPKDFFEKLYMELKSVTHKIPEMEIEENSIRVLFPQDLYMRDDLPSTLISTIEGLFPTEKRTDKVIGEFSKLVGETIRDCVQKDLFLGDSGDPFLFVGVNSWSTESKERHWNSLKK